MLFNISGLPCTVPYNDSRTAGFEVFRTGAETLEKPYNLGFLIKLDLQTIEGNQLHQHQKIFREKL